jgi:anti-sigma factor RsiW
MTCEEISRLIDPYLDGELDLSSCVAVEDHCASCAACRGKMEARQKLLVTIREETPRFETPPFLAARINAALRSETAAKTPFWLAIPSAWIYSAVGGAVAVAAIALLVQTSEGPFAEIAREGVSNHVRSLQLNHLMDVASTDQHTVKPWFAGKVDFSPQVVDLGPSGFPLVGGRLDVLDQHDVAALVYRRRQHYVNLFIWPVRECSLGDRLYAKDGYRALGWTKWGMNYLAVSELSENELKDFAHLIKDYVAPPIE